MLNILAPYLGFFSVSLLVALSPGPSWVYTISTALNHGKKAGMIGNLGNSTGILCHAAAVALGLVTLLNISSSAFLLLKFLGAGYLFYLAWQAFRQESTLQQPMVQSKLSRRKIFRNGALVSLFNPKISLLMLALLPQFVTPDGLREEFQIAILGGLHALTAGVVHTHVVFFAGGISQKIKNKGGLQKFLRWGKGSLFLWFGLQIAFDRQT